MYLYHRISEEQFEDTKWVIRRPKLKKDRIYNGQENGQKDEQLCSGCFFNAYTKM